MTTSLPPSSNAEGTTSLLPADRRFVYPFIEYDLVENDYLKVWNHDQIARYRGLHAPAPRRGCASATPPPPSVPPLTPSSCRPPLHAASAAAASSTLLLYSDFSGRLQGGALRNGVLDASARYYKEQKQELAVLLDATGDQGLESRP